jgi:hypothetical protein
MTTYTEHREYGVPIIFDVTADSRQDAGNSLVKMLAGHNLPGTVDNCRTIESWWTLEGIDKPFDRNDNDAGVVLFAEDLDYLLRLLEMTAEQASPTSDHARHARLIRYLRPENRVGWTHDETEGA